MTFTDGTPREFSASRLECLVMTVVPERGEGESVAVVPRRRVSGEEYTAWAIILALILFILYRHYVSGAIAGLGLYLILDRVSESFAKRFSRGAVRPLALLVVALSTAAIVIGAVALLMTVMRHGAGNIAALMTQMAEILESTRAWLGSFGNQVIPEVLTDAEDFKATVAAWLKTHAQTVRMATGVVGIGLVHIIMGALLAVLVFFRHVTHKDDDHRGPLALQLVDKVDRFAHAFGRIAAAQLKISAVNTTLTSLYLLVALPMFGITVPFGKTLVLITFVCGLIPVAGNLISNTVITIISLGVSGGTAIASLTFLIVVHKLEYLINSRIVGAETDSEAWEILAAIIIGEATFGVGGVVLAPIVYAFVKRELRDLGLV